MSTRIQAGRRFRAGLAFAVAFAMAATTFGVPRNPASATGADPGIEIEACLVAADTGKADALIGFFREHGSAMTRQRFDEALVFETGAATLFDTALDTEKRRAAATRISAGAFDRGRLELLARRNAAVNNGAATFSFAPLVPVITDIPNTDVLRFIKTGVRLRIQAQPMERESIQLVVALESSFPNYTPVLRSRQQLPHLETVGERREISAVATDGGTVVIRGLRGPDGWELLLFLTPRKAA